MRAHPGALLATWAAVIVLVAPTQAQDAAGTQTKWLVRGTLHTAAGDAIEDGHVVLAQGKIASAGVGAGAGDDVFEAAHVTPGLIDLSVRISTRDYSVEQSSETPVELDVLDAVDLYSFRWRRELRNGVTTVLVFPYDNAVLGGTGAVLKTGGAPSVEARLVKREAVLRASIGSQPSIGNFPPRGVPPVTFYARRPTTRMGVEWVFRKAYHDALRAAARPSSETTDLERERNAVLERTLRGELPVAVQAWSTQDIRTAVYMKEEFRLPHMFVDAAAEAWREPELLVRSGMGVVLPPFSFEGRLGAESSFLAADTAARLHARGVMLALSGHGAKDPGQRLARQPGYAMRGGLPFGAALAAVTINPARMVGVADRVGSIEAGKDGDLVCWNGPPFELSSRIIGVFLNGRLVHDARPQ